MWDEPVSYGQAKREWDLEVRMDEYKQDAMIQLSKIVSEDYLEEIAGILAYSYLQEDKDAERIASHLDLDQLHFHAILGEKQKFEQRITNNI